MIRPCTTAALIIWSTHGSGGGREAATDDWAGGASGMAGSEAALTDYAKWGWEVVPDKCAHPEFHRPMRAAGRGRGGGKKSKAGARGRKLLALAAAVRRYTQMEVDDFSGSQEGRQGLTLVPHFSSQPELLCH